MRAGNRIVAAGILLVALLLAGGASFYASGSPDGLESVASDKGFIDTAEDHATGSGPFADYDATFLDDERGSVGVAGVVGVLVVLALGSGIAYAVRRSAPASARDESTASV